MNSLAPLMRKHQTALIQHYQTRMRTQHYAALQAIIDCHTPVCGSLTYECHSCSKQQRYYQSCGHRSCPACQHRTNNQWLDRQRKKLLPVDYYMVTFTLPFELRHFAWNNQRWAYKTLFTTAVQTLSKFANHDKQLKVTLGMTGVLHTHSRRLDFHPHVHFIVPNGGFSNNRRRWKQKHGNYLFNGNALANVFRGKFLAAMKQDGMHVSVKTPRQWIAQCQAVGKGGPALIYLARYLYRGVINERNIINADNDNVTFRYQDSTTKCWKTRTEPVLRFLWLVLQHVLPKGFRRTRDYGFLHGNAKKIRQRLQLILRVKLPVENKPVKQTPNCPCCGLAMRFLGFVRYKPIIHR